MIMQHGYTWNIHINAFLFEKIGKKCCESNVIRLFLVLDECISLIQKGKYCICTPDGAKYGKIPITFNAF